MPQLRVRGESTPPGDPAAASLTADAEVGVTPRSAGVLRRVPALVVDVLVAAAVAVVVTAAIRVASEPGARPADALAYGLGVLMAALLLVRRRWPLGVLLATAIVLLAYYSLRYPAVTPALPLAAALFTASAAGRLRWASLVIAFYTVAGVYVPLLHRYEPPLSVLAGVTERTTGMVAVALLGEVLRSRRLRQAASEERLRQLHKERVAETAHHVMEERLRIARDIHDVVGHTIAAISVHAGLAEQILERKPAEARSALRTVRSACRQARAELKAAIGVLRTNQEDAREQPTAPGLGDLEVLLEPVRRAGLRVTVTQDADAGSLPAVVDLCAYRIVQEALTNVVRHARATQVSVSVRRTADELLVEVADDGSGPTAPAGVREPGHGIIGMTERAAALNGSLEAGRGPDGGFRVRARLPILGERA